MYMVLVYISHIVWTFDSSPRGMQAKLQYSVILVLYRPNATNIHYKIRFLALGVSTATRWGLVGNQYGEE